MPLPIESRSGMFYSTLAGCDFKIYEYEGDSVMAQSLLADQQSIRL